MTKCKNEGINREESANREVVGWVKKPMVAREKKTLFMPKSRGLGQPHRPAPGVRSFVAISTSAQRASLCR